MRTMRFALSLSLVAALSIAAPAAAAPPVGACPAHSSGYFIVDQQEWWDITVEGFEAEGISVYVDGDPANGFTAEFDVFAAAAGFGSAQGLYDFVWITQWQKLDKNGDLQLCMKRRPVTVGNPAYFFNGIDNSMP